MLCRSDHLGDVLLTLPAVAGIRAALPDAHLAYVAAPGPASLLACCPMLDEVVPVPFPDVCDGDAPPLVDVADGLRGRFDVAVLFRPGDRHASPLVELAGVPDRVGYDIAPQAEMLTGVVPFAPGDAVAGAMRVASLAVRLAGGTPLRAPDPSLPLLHVTAEGERQAASVGARQPPVVIHPGAGWAVKHWSPRAWGTVAAALVGEGQQVVVVGGPGEGLLVEEVVAASGGVAAAAPALSLPGLAALHRRSRLVVGVDSGALHIARLMGAPVVGLYGPVDPDAYTPWGRAPWRAVTASVPCRPCGTLSEPPCGATTGAACMTAISPEEVIGAARRLLPHRHHASC